MENKDLLDLRKKIKASKPKFNRQNSGRIKRLGSKWRKPKGIDAKLRLRYAKRKMVSAGYGSPKGVKGLDRNGIEEVMVHNVSDLEKVNKKTAGIVVSGKVGTAKRVAILEKALSMKIRILNFKSPEDYIKGIKDKLSETKKQKKEAEKKEEQPKKEEKKDDAGSIEDKLSEEEKKKLEKKELDRLLTKKF